MLYVLTQRIDFVQINNAAPDLSSNWIEISLLSAERDVGATSTTTAEIAWTWDPTALMEPLIRRGSTGGTLAHGDPSIRRDLMRERQMLDRILHEAAKNYGDKTALISNSRALTYRELDDLSSAFARALIKQGTMEGDRVSIYSQNRWEWVVAYHGILKAGAVVNPINVMLTAEEVGFVLNNCGARAVVTSGDKADAILALAPEVTWTV